MVILRGGSEEDRKGGDRRLATVIRKFFGESDRAVEGRRALKLYCEGRSWAREV